EIGAPGDLGYIVSRWERRDKDGKTTGSGHQVTIWKWWPKANWKLLALIRTSDPSSPDSSAMRALRHESGAMMSHDAVATANQTLLEADRGLASAAATMEFEKAFEARSSADVLLLRPGIPPARGKKGTVAVLRSTPGRWSCEPRASRSSG